MKHQGRQMKMKMKVDPSSLIERNKQLLKIVSWSFYIPVFIKICFIIFWSQFSLWNLVPFFVANLLSLSFIISIKEKAAEPEEALKQGVKAKKIRVVDLISPGPHQVMIDWVYIGAVVNLISIWTAYVWLLYLGIPAYQIYAKFSSK